MRAHQLAVVFLHLSGTVEADLHGMEVHLNGEDLDLFAWTSQFGTLHLRISRLFGVACNLTIQELRTVYTQVQLPKQLMAVSHGACSGAFWLDGVQVTLVILFGHRENISPVTD